MKAQRRAISGVLLLNKPTGISSTSAVGWAKRLFNAAKAGHTGTLDPFATGLLPICFGEAAKYARFHLDADKHYRATLKLGERSSTGDTEGEIVETHPVDCTLEHIHAALAAHTGKMQQTPPMHSAIKIGGVPLYKLARKGVDAERPARAIEVKALVCVEWSAPHLVIDAHVSKGTYMRVLAEDIGRALGCGAHLVALQRTGSGRLALSQAVSFDTLEEMAPDQRDRMLLPPETLAESLPMAILEAPAARAFSNGRPVAHDLTIREGAARVYGPGGLFLGVATVNKSDISSTLVPERLMSNSSPQSD